jgi:hypothetical protein
MATDISVLADVTNQIQKYWAPTFTKELRASHLLGSLVNREYEGQILKGGDTVYVSQVNAPTGQLLTVGTDANSFDSEAVSTSRVTIQANKRAVAAYEFEDLVSLQSQIDLEKSDVRQSLMWAIQNKINTYLYSLAVPSTSSPDHTIASVTDMNAGQLSATRVLAGQAKWPMDKPWYGLLDPQYYADVMDDTTMGSSDFGAADAPMISGRLALPRFGFMLFEDTSLSADNGYFFYPDFMHLVQQPQVQVKVSDLHSQKKFGYLLSVDLIFGAVLGISGANKHIRVYNS